MKNQIDQNPELPPQELTADAESIGTRLDTWLSRLPGAPSRNRVQQLVKDGHVLVDGLKAKRSYTLIGREKITVNWPPPEDDWPWPEDIPIDVVYHDDSFIIVNKPPGLITHPSAGNPDGTLVNAILHHFPDLPGINGRRRPGIVHRLDRNTTGLMVIAKTERAMNSIAKQLIERIVERRYLALAIGDTEWEKKTVEADVGMDTSNRLRRMIDGTHSKFARSHFTTLARSHQFTLVRCKLDTGRTHQIRIHLKHIGHPIVCDDTYDGHVNRCLERLTPQQHNIKRLLMHYQRPWLHAHTLRFRHPETWEYVYFQAPPPQDSIDVIRGIFGDKVDEICGERLIEVPEKESHHSEEAENPSPEQSEET